MINYDYKKLTNGLQLITAPLGNTKAMTVLFLVNVGSRYEDKRLNGISHFLEHMFFKGTKKRPTTLDIAKALDSVGAAYNAYTSEEHTGFYVHASSENFPLALDILFDMLYNSKFTKEEIEREKGVICEEINMYQDNPQSYIAELAKRLIYGDQPLGRQVTGEKQTVTKFTRQDFLKYRIDHYTPKNIVIAIAGDQNTHHWQNKVEEYFSRIPLAKENQYKKIKESQIKPQSLVHYKKTDQAHLILGFRTFKTTDSRRPILKVLANLLGETMSSRLFTEVRERRGLAYYISSDVTSFKDAGVLSASAGVDIKRAEEAVKVILNEFEKIKTGKISNEELNRAKENLKGRLYLSLEESFSVAEFLAEQQLYFGKIESPEEIIAKYAKVTVEDIKKFAYEFLVAKNLNLAIIGPFKDKEKFQKIINSF